MSGWNLIVQIKADNNRIFDVRYLTEAAAFIRTNAELYSKSVSNKFVIIFDLNENILRKEFFLSNILADLF